MASVHTIAGLWRTDSTPNGQETDLNPSRFKSFRSSFDLHFQRMFCGVLAYILSTRISLVQNVKRPKLRPTWLGLSLASNQSFRQLVSAEHEPSLLGSRIPKSRRPACAYPLPRTAPTFSGRNDDDLHICLTIRVSMGRRLRRTKA